MEYKPTGGKAPSFSRVGLEEQEKKGSRLVN